MNIAFTNTVRVIDSAQTRLPLPIVIGEGGANAVLWPENGARHRTINVIDLGDGGRTMDLNHAHECVYYIASGDGHIRDLETGEAQELIEGAMIHIGPRDAYRLEAGKAGMKAIGGCVPVDPELYQLNAEGNAS